MEKIRWDNNRLGCNYEGYRKSTIQEMKFILMSPINPKEAYTAAEKSRNSLSSEYSDDSLLENAAHNPASTSDESESSFCAPTRRRVPTRPECIHTISRSFQKNSAQYKKNPLLKEQPKGMQSAISWSLAKNAEIASSSAEKTRIFRRTLTVILSCTYAIFLITIGVVIGVATFLVPNSSIDEVFGIYLTVTGLLWFVFIHFDLLLHSGKMRQHILEQNKLQAGKHYMYDHDLTGRLLSDPSYMFSLSRHSGSFFLKIGAVGFCFVHLIHSALLLTRKIMQLTSEKEDIRVHCGDSLGLILAILYPVYSFYQLFIIFKYSSVIINRCKELARFATMHCLATSLFFWLYMILIETSHSLHHDIKQTHVGTVHKYAGFSSSEEQYLSFIEFSPGNGEIPSTLAQIMNNSLVLSTTGLCDVDSDITTIISEFSPYLYPFSIEYSILVVGIWYIIWSNIGKVQEEKEVLSCLPHSSIVQTQYLENGLSNRLIIHADCHASNRGLFLGLLVLAGSIVVVFIIFIGSSDQEFMKHAVLASSLFEVLLLVMMIISVLIAYRQMTRLHINPNPISQLDDCLLFICIPLFFLYGIFCIVPALAVRNFLAIALILMQVVQVIIQTPFLIDALRRCSNSATLRARKPGREFVTFLIVANMAMWVLNTFEIKSHETHLERIRFYGQPLWTFLSHVTLPLTLFYRFHSSVCLVDVWKSAYEPGDH
ncbi:proton channel OtopLc-like isoform X2 [Artemia franciscana]|uniref:proton channel OtopLc-like isoform X2 n=1 Tax=Artemia franciscana TaxID=6661 RepID=UPI0032DA93B7